MPNRIMPMTFPPHVAQTQLDSLIQKAMRENARFVITKRGKPVAVLLATTDLDDLLEEPDPEFQKSLRSASREYRSGRAVGLQDYHR